ncbi:MAG: class I SAM-dependent methyltransferase [Proteobacteria bacterium]|nr:class I SAM-dependent methyltransferase [Pseudomonadota bacterium]
MIRVGKLEVIDAYGNYHVFSGTPGCEATVRLYDSALHRKLFFNPDLHVGEAYMNGTLIVEKGTLSDFLEILVTNLGAAQTYPMYSACEWFSRVLRGWQQYNPVGRSRSNAAHHYDLPDQLYDQFLDRDRQYSCAYFLSPDDDLDTAQANKQRHLAAKLLLEPGVSVLDIGSGWGGLALYLARVGGGQVTGLTLSDKQVKMANRRAAEAGLSDRVRFYLRDYREETGTYDRIVSVGMFEHVGINHYREFFSTVRNLLAEDGLCVLHSIGRMAGPSTTCAWLRRYIFPGGYSPSLSEVLPAIEDSGLWIADIEVLRLHYAETLRAWQHRFQENRARIAELFDERFCRKWEFYLALSEAAFRHGDHFVFQIQLSKRRDAAPLTRDYITDWERTHTAETSPYPSEMVA